MSCDAAQRALSAAFDGEVDAGGSSVQAALAHRGTCADCRRFSEHLERARAHLRPPATGTADLAPAVLRRIRLEGTTPSTTCPSPTLPPTHPHPHHLHQRRAHRRGPVPAAAVFVATALAAALLVHTSTDGPDVAGAGLPERVIEAQHDVLSLSAHLSIFERGWNPAVPARRFSGSLRYRAPETLALTLRDRTDYPDRSWAPNDLTLAVDQDTWAVTGLRDCPSRAQPDCTPDERDQRSVTGREPFSAATPAPLDLIMPVQSFALAGSSVTLPDDLVGGRPTIGIEATAAQVAPLLDGLHPTGNLRRAHPADPVELRLDRDTLVPLRVTVFAGRGPDRRAWADARGYRDRSGEVIIDVQLTQVVVNGPDPASPTPAPTTTAAPSAPTAPSTASPLDAGFRDRTVGAADAPRPTHLPAGLRAYRSGVLDTPEGPRVATRTWTDGRAWLAVSATSEWPGRRLFGDLGDLVRPLDLGAGGRGYLSEDGERIGLHTPGLDVVVAGSVSRAELLEAAATLGVVGATVPTGWEEAATADVAAARAVVAPLLLPADLDGFAPPALRIDGTRVTASFAGPGDRSFALEQSPAPKLPPPPATPDGVVAVRVRGGPGRYGVARGELEWHEGGRLYRLHSLTLPRAELLAIADGLAPV